MIFKVEVLAIYLNPGESVTQQRRNHRDSDFSEAQTLIGQVGQFDAPGEYLETFEGNRYGFGWACGQFINVRADGDSVGRAIATRLETRSMRDGSRVLVFEHLADEGNPYQTGALLFQRSWPVQPTDVSLANR